MLHARNNNVPCRHIQGGADMELTPKQKRFADEYIKNGGNAAQAAKSAGYKYYEGQGRENKRKPAIKAYIAKRQAEIDKQNGTDIMSLADIQAFRARVIKGEEKDAFGLDAGLTDRLKAANDLEKALKIKEEQEEKKRQAEAAMKSKTYHMDLDIIPDTFHSVIRDIRNHKHLEYVFKGGRGSTKSSTVANMILELMKNNHDVHAVVCRKVGNTIKDSVYAKIKWAIGKQDFTEEFDAKKSPLEITLTATGQKIYFRGADDPDKIKSITPEFGYIGILWFEELDQFSGEEEVRKIEQSAIRGGDKAWIFKTFNPPKTANNWANKYVKTPKENRVVHHSTYHDVPVEWLGQPFIDEAEHLKEVNPDAYDHEYGGIANGNGGNVFEYLDFREITDEEIAMFDRIYQGVDWGWFPDHYAFIRSYYNHNTETIYLIDENYVNKTSNAETGQWIKDKEYTDYNITCDSAENKSINDYRDIDIPARPAVKGPGSVEYGMKWLQTKHIVIDQRRTPNAYKELSEYEYERDKEGNPISGYPDENNHIIDALRYSYEPLWSRRGSSA